MSKKILSFEEYVREADRSEEIEKEVNDVGEVENLEDEVEDNEEEVEVAEEEETEEEAEEETEEETEDVSETRAVAEMLKETYESACKEAAAYEGDEYEEHTVESYVKEMAALNASMMTEMYEKTYNEVKEGEMTRETYEAACESMKESYAKKMDELKETYGNESAEVQESFLANFTYISTNEQFSILEEAIEFSLLEEGWLKQVLGYTFFLPLTLTNALYQLTMKKIKIKKMLKSETDPKKKEALQQELKGMKYEEVKIKEKIEDQKSKMKDAADAQKGKASPEEKEKYAKQKEKMQAKLDKQKEKLKKAQGEFNGLV